MTTPAWVNGRSELAEMAMRRLAREIEERFARIDARKSAERTCINCRHCKVIPNNNAEATHPDATCARGLWGKVLPLPVVARGRANELRGRTECPEWESSTKA